jgi:hypothetical protein
VKHLLLTGLVSLMALAPPVLAHAGYGDGVDTFRVAPAGRAP